MTDRMDDARQRIEAELKNYGINDEMFRGVIAGSIIHALSLSKVYDELDRLDAEVSELDDERCDFDCDECQDGQPVSLAAQHFPPEALT